MVWAALAIDIAKEYPLLAVREIRKALVECSSVGARPKLFIGAVSDVVVHVSATRAELRGWSCKVADTDGRRQMSCEICFLNLNFCLLFGARSIRKERKFETNLFHAGKKTQEGCHLGKKTQENIETVSEKGATQARNL